MIKVVSFDIDGTIMDFNYNRAFWDEAIPHMYSNKHSITIEKAKEIVFAEYKSVSQKDARWHSPSFWFKKLGIGNHKDVMLDLKHHIRLYPETVPALRELSKKFMLITITGNTTEFVDIKMKTEGIDKFFSRNFSVVDEFNDMKSKEVFINIASKLGIECHEMVHIGDDLLFDYIEAKKAGVNALLIERDDQYHRFKRPEYADKVDPQHIIKDLRELATKIENMGR